LGFLSGGTIEEEEEGPVGRRHDFMCIARGFLRKANGRKARWVE